MEQADKVIEEQNVEQSSTEQLGILLRDATTPIVLDLRKKKKRRYSRGLKNIQIMERRFSKASHRTARAVERGFGTYRKYRNRSARKTRDGAIQDFAPNVARGLGKTIRVASLVPYDLAQAFNTRKSRRRRRIRFASNLVRSFW